MPAMTHAVEDPLQVARGARGRHAWAEAFEAYQAADRAQPLGGADLEGLAEAAFFVAEPDVQLEAKERAFTTYEAEGDHERAAFLAHQHRPRARLCGQVRDRERLDQARRAAHRIGGRHPRPRLPRPGHSEAAHGAGDLERATALADRAIAISEARTDPDLKAFALSNLGELKIAFGDTNDGIALMEEASLAAVNGELTPFTTGITACRVIGACRDLTDYRRASEWIEATERYCTRQACPGSRASAGSTGPRSRPSAARGTRPSRSSSAPPSSSSAFRATPPQADGYYAIGEIRRLRGDLEGAEAALREAHARGRIAAAGTGPDPTGRRERQGRRPRHRRRPRRAHGRPLGAGPTAAGPGRGRRRDGRHRFARGGPPMSWRPRCPAIRRRRSRRRGTSWPVRSCSPTNDAAEAVAELRAGIAGWRDVGARTRSRGRGSCWPAPCEPSATRTAPTWSARPRATRSGASARGSTSTRSSRRRATSRPGGPARPPPGRTFAFTDIVGSTELAETLGDAGLGGTAALARRHVRLDRRAPPGRDREVDRRRVLRHVRGRAPGRRCGHRDPAGHAGRPSERQHAGARPDRPPYGRREPALRRLQRPRRPHRRPGLRPGRSGRDRRPRRPHWPRPATSRSWPRPSRRRSRASRSLSRWRWSAGMTAARAHEGRLARTLRLTGRRRAARHRRPRCRPATRSSCGSRPRPSIGPTSTSSTRSRASPAHSWASVGRATDGSAVTSPASSSRSVRT